MHVNTTPNVPNQMPTALMLPSGQIVPVVPHSNPPNIMMPNQVGLQQPVLAAGNGGFQILSGGSVAQAKQPTISAIVSGAGVKSGMAHTNTVHYLPVGPSNAVVNAQTKQPVIISSIAPKPTAARPLQPLPIAAAGKGALQLGAGALAQIRCKTRALSFFCLS